MFEYVLCWRNFSSIVIASVVLWQCRYFSFWDYFELIKKFLSTDNIFDNITPQSFKIHFQLELTDYPCNRPQGRAKIHSKKMRFGLTPIELALFKLNRIQYFWQALNGGDQKVTIIIIWASTQHSNSQITVMFKATFSSDSSLHIIIFIECIFVE